MLEKIIQKNTEKSEISEQLKGLREQLTLLENKIKTAGMPVIITFAPSATHFFAAKNPIPLLPPVIKICLPFIVSFGATVYVFTVK